MKNRSLRILVIICVIIALLPTVSLVVFSCASVETVDVNSGVVLCKNEGNHIKVTGKVVISSHVMVSARYRIENDKIYIKFYQAPVWTLFLFFRRNMWTINIPIDPNIDYTIYREDNSKQLEIEFYEPLEE